MASGSRNFEDRLSIEDSSEGNADYVFKISDSEINEDIERYLGNIKFEELSSVEQFLDSIKQEEL